MQRWIAGSFFTLSTLGLLACDPIPEPSDLGHWTLDVGLGNSLAGLEQPSVVLVDSVFTANVLQREDESGRYVRLEPELDACVFTFGMGVVVEDEAGFRVSGPGEGAVGISAPHEACPDYEGPNQDLERDAWSIVAVEPELTSGAWVPAIEAGLFDLAFVGADPFPADFASALEQARVVEGGEFYLAPVLTYADAEVRWASVAMQTQVDPAWQHLIHFIEDGVPSLDLRGQLDAGDQVDASLVIGEVPVALPRLEAVALDQITQIELVPVYQRERSDARPWGSPLGVVAITRDTQGQRILGAPIEWTLTRGKLAMNTFEDPSRTPDVLGVADLCRARPIVQAQRSATIEARIGDLATSIELDWIALHADDIDPDNTKCESAGCDCSASGEPIDSLAALLALLGLGLLRRRQTPRAKSWASKPSLARQQMSKTSTKPRSPS